MKVIPGQIKTGELHALMLGAVAPRPIAFASTINNKGVMNLSPFSFFNAFGSKPPILVFSPARRVRDNTIKHTLENIYENKEVVINVVNYAMVQQASLSSCEYPKEVSEFVKAGFTPVPSDKVKPFRVKESPVQFECKVLNVIETGTEGGAGNLVICEILVMHINDEVLDENGKIDPHKIDLVARMGGDYYSRASGNAVFTVPKPNLKLGIGFDNLPSSILQSNVLTGNDLGLLANLETLPAEEEINSFKADPSNASLLSDKSMQHQHAKNLLAEGKVKQAMLLLLS
ncbi:MAG: flavin reductase family protein [Bacteroidia bacterium]|nr:flavin reductase family protein [Bacteroidia bacterium]